MTPVKAVLHGYGSEYVLGGLAVYLRSKGWRVTELGVQGWDNEVWQSLKEEEIDVFISSAHFTRDGFAISQMYPEVGFFPSALEIIRALRPRKSVFATHDLATPLVLNEYQYLDLFDLVIWPNLQFRPRVADSKMVITPWIRFAEIVASSQSYSGIWFLSETTHLMKHHGPSALAQLLLPAISAGVKIKLPAWAGLENLEQAIRELRSDAIVEATLSTTQTMSEANVVYTNGGSACVYEARLLKKKVVNFAMGSPDSRVFASDPEVICISEPKNFDFSLVADVTTELDAVAFNEIYPAIETSILRQLRS